MASPLCMGEFEVLPRASNSFWSFEITPEDLCSKGESSDNAHQLCRFIVAYLTFLEDSPLYRTKGPKPRKLLSRFSRDLTSGHLIDLLKFYASLGDALTVSVTSSAFGTRQSYLEQMEGTPVFKEYLEFFRTGDTDCYRFVLSFLWFGKKMDYLDKSFDEIALRNWRQVELELSELRLPQSVDQLSQIVTWVLPQLSDGPLFPKFGPGAVSEPGVRGMLEKTNLDYSAKIDRAFFRQIAFTNRDPDFTLAVDHRVLPSRDSWSPLFRNSLEVSKLKFVPKNIKTSRSICMEPNTYMYFQQSLAERISRVLPKSHLGRFIDLRDQGRNRYLARYGSMYNTIDTIDLASASDRLSLELTRKVFPREWLYYLTATRSSRVELPDGSIVRVNKFAPMGSALCFPIQCIMFTCICIQAAMKFIGERADGFDSLPFDRQMQEVLASFNDRPGEISGFEPLSVFGDDICVDSRLTRYVTSLLSEYGFSVNHDKSFTGDLAFRESCGGFYLGGDDVTPVFYRVKRFGSLISAEIVANLLGLVNSTPGTNKKYRRYLHTLLTTHAPHLVYGNRPGPGVIVVPREGHLWSLNPHLKSRWNRDLQRREVRARFPAVVELELAAQGSEFERVENYLYLQWVRATFRGSDGVGNGIHEPVSQPLRGIAANIRMVWRWIPDQY